jgi:hypothetical protein
VLGAFAAIVLRGSCAGGVCCGHTGGGRWSSDDVVNVGAVGVNKVCLD